MVMLFKAAPRDEIQDRSLSIDMGHPVALTPRLDPYSASPETMQEFMSFQEFLNTTGLDVALMELIRTRVSQINGCAHGIGRHTRAARALGESEDRLYLLDAWRAAPLYSERERAALALTEAVTLVTQAQVPDDVFEGARQWFSEEDLVKLTAVIVATNAWNRLEMTFRQIPTGRIDR
jgi:AhpD family alkylhydroperoxidase